ncbi:hypothetical protein VPH35_095577 [Triticum aestivum]
MSEAEVVANAWKEWGLQALVLLSFTFQVALLVLAEFRRCVDSGALRALVWSAYTLADATAIYVLGHMSVISRSPEHELMAFWAPFLLLHLGGQDNITAYAIEDNLLWLRHLQTLAVQVAAATYVMYESSILGQRSLLRPATVLVFVVGVIKYGERVWALKRAGTSPGGSNYRSVERHQVKHMFSYEVVTDAAGRVLDTEALLLIAHQLLEVPKDLFLDGAVSTEGLGTDLTKENVYKVAEMQLSLMHDLFYTKAGVMHTWHGLCIRIISLVATSTALLLLFQVLGGGHKGNYSALDVAVTYVLLVGAVVLEITSVSRVMLSSGTCAVLAGRNKAWHLLLARVILSLRRLIHAADWRRRCSWSRSMGQHNMLRLCACSTASRSSKMARWMGVEDLWNLLAYSWSVPVSSSIEQLIVKQLLDRSWRWSPDLIIVAQAWELMKKWELDQELAWTVEETILVWHIATDLYLRWYKGEEVTGGEDDAERRRRADLAEAVEALSNYMLFLLASRPYMLPPSTDRNAYVQTCYALLPPGKGDTTRQLALPALEYRSAEVLASSLLRIGNAFITGSPEISFQTSTAVTDRYDSSMAIIGARLGAKLIGEDGLAGSATGAMLELTAQVWIEILFYIACRCSAYSHAKQLSNGSELITVVALLVRYITSGEIHHKGGVVIESPAMSDPAHSLDRSEHSSDNVSEGNMP